MNYRVASLLTRTIMIISIAAIRILPKKIILINKKGVRGYFRGKRDI